MAQWGQLIILEMVFLMEVGSTAPTGQMVQIQQTIHLDPHQILVMVFRMEVDFNDFKVLLLKY